MHPIQTHDARPAAGALTALILLALSCCALSTADAHAQPVPTVARDGDTTPVSLRGEWGLGYGWPGGQMAEVFDDGGLQIYMLLGARLESVAIESFFRAQGLSSPLVDVMSVASVGLQARYLIGLGERFELGLGGALTYNWLMADAETCHCDAAQPFLDHAGAGVDALVSLSYDVLPPHENLGDRLYLITELRRAHVGLENTPIERTIKGGVTQWTLGMGADILMR